MKLISSVLFSTLAHASHYHGGTFRVTQQGNNQISIVNTQAWRQGSQYWGGCEESDVINQVQSDGLIRASCPSYLSVSSCPTTHLYYTALFVGDNYCYGDGQNIITKPSGPFTFGWTQCCWTNLTSDQGTYYRNEWGKVNQFMTVNDVNNNSPTFKMPPRWIIMAGCPDQQIDLAPTDVDGDTIRCRWARPTEAGGVTYNAAKHPSLSLDQENCIVKYDGTMDQSTVGVKPIGLMMEDFDSNGQVRSSIPVQFLAQVWTPNLNTRSIGYDNYPDWFGEHDEHPDHVDVPARGRRSVPSYCSAAPTFVEPTPVDGAQINGSSGSVSFVLKASSDYGRISGFSYQAPIGLTCTKVDNDGAITCSWTMTAEQLKTEQQPFCYEATDSLGLVSERRCLNISGRGNKITNISEMASAVLDGSGAQGFTAADGNDYGCAGRGNFDPFAITAGHQVDSADKAFYVWKKCVQCAVGNNAANIEAYDYDQANDSCGKFWSEFGLSLILRTFAKCLFLANSSASSRGVCECDRALVNALYDEVPANTNFDADSCTQGKLLKLLKRSFNFGYRWYKRAPMLQLE